MITGRKRIDYIVKFGLLPQLLQAYPGKSITALTRTTENLSLADYDELYKQLCEEKEK